MMIKKQFCCESDAVRKWGCCCSVTQSCRLFATPWTVSCQAPLSFTVSWSFLRLMSIELMIPSNHLIYHWILSVKRHWEPQIHRKQWWTLWFSNLYANIPPSSILPANSIQSLVTDSQNCSQILTSGNVSMWGHGWAMVMVIPCVNEHIKPFSIYHSLVSTLFLLLSFIIIIKNDA